MRVLRYDDPIRLSSNSDDVTHKTTWTLGASTCLRVTPLGGQPTVIRGAPIVAEYYHVGRFLDVAVGPENDQQLYGYVEPAAWSTIPCPPE